MNTEPETLLEKAAEVLANAHSPYSGYRVGAALLAADGGIFTGCNVENASYGLTICAERGAFSSAVTAGCREFTAMAIVADGKETPYPCGACRQVIAEFCGPDLPVYVARKDALDEFETMTLGELLPKTFSFKK